MRGENSLPLPVGWVGDANWSCAERGQNVGMLQIGGVLAHNNQHPMLLNIPLFLTAETPHGSTRHSLYRSVG